MPHHPWHQHRITFADRATAQHTITTRLAPALLAADASAEISGWWYMNKQPWPLRYRALQPSGVIRTALDALVAEGAAERWTTVVYEPEAAAFGGQAAMEVAHDLFHHDSLHLLTYPRVPGHLGARQTAVVLLAAMMRAAGLDWFEQGDVWIKIRDLRCDLAAAAPSEAAHAAMHTLMTADVLGRSDGPLQEHGEWVRAFAEAGTRLAAIASRGELARGLRAVIAHHLIFHANRAGIPATDQASLAELAGKVVMGSADTTPTSAQVTSTDTSVGAMSTHTIASPGTDAEQLRNALVDQIRAEGHATTTAVEAALRTVPRHAFVPNTSLPEAYANTPVNIKFDGDGTSISCASQPSVVALMLDQLQARPGERILELGAGTGYNAALLGHLVGPTGHVTTLDVDDDLVEGARVNLRVAGVDNVEAVTRDGALGYAEAAPFDKIIATVGAHGIPHAWLDQLSPGGRLVTPQRLKGSVSRSIAYENHDGRWLSVGSEMNTFMPLRRGIADDDRRTIALSSDATVRLHAPAGARIDADALAGVLDLPRTERWTGVTFRAMESPEWMELFVTCAVPSGLIRMLFPATAKGTILADDPYPSSTAAADHGTVTYLARRLSPRTTPEGGKLWEFGVVGHGPDRDTLIEQVTQALQTWDREYRDREATFEILGSTPEPRPGQYVLDTPLNRIVVTW